jgi:hypothetical protein
MELTLQHFVNKVRSLVWNAGSEKDCFAWQNIEENLKKHNPELDIIKDKIVFMFPEHPQAEKGKNI